MFWKLILTLGVLCAVTACLPLTAPGDDGNPLAPASSPASHPVVGAVPVDPGLPEYEHVVSVSGTIRSVGSAPVSSLLVAWGDEFKKLYPKVEVEINAGGSSLAPEALVSSKPPQLAAMDRPMNRSELNLFRQKFGYEPTGIRVAVTALTVYVNVDNPCTGLTLAQLDGILSRTFRAGHDPIHTWGQAGVTDPKWVDEPVVIHLPRKGRAAYDILKSRVLLDGEFRYDASTELTATAILQEVAVDRGGIGIAGNLFRTRRTRALPIQAADGVFYEPTYKNTVNGAYPLSTHFYLYVNKPPRKPLDRLTREFLSFACCETAQAITAAENAYPLTPQLASEAMKLIGP